MATRTRISPGGVTLLAAVLLTVLVTVLAGCTSGSGGLGAPATDRAERGDAAAEPGGAAGGPPDDESGRASGGNADGEADGGAAGGSGRGSSLVRTAPDDEAIVYTATVRVRSRDVAAAASRAERIVSDAGGYVHDQRTTSARQDRGRATITFKVPASRYRVVLDELGSRLGTRLRLEQRAEDVSQQVADVDARLRSAQASLDRLRQLLTDADSVEEVLSVEREIAERESELESLQARQRTLENRTRYATVTVELVAPAAPDRTDANFLTGLSAGWGAFVGTLDLFATVFGASLPFLAAFGLVGYGAWRLWRLGRLRRRRAPTPPAPEPPS